MSTRSASDQHPMEPAGNHEADRWRTAGGHRYR